MPDQLHCRFFVLRYAPDAVKNEFVNIGLVLLPPAGSAQVRFTRDWSRVLCLDPEATPSSLFASSMTHSPTPCNRQNSRLALPERPRPKRTN
jgi:hypothetical protein